MVEDLDRTSLKLVNSSGYPLQIAVRHAVEESSEKHGWRVLAEEFPWKNDVSAKDGFVDIILENSLRTQIFLVECKRVRDSQWIFLLPSECQSETKRAKSWAALHEDWFHWLDWEPEPQTYESKYCVIPGKEEGRKAIIEREASKLVEATESFAEAEKSRGIVAKNNYKFYSSVIVTNANLRVCKFESRVIDLGTGELDEAIFEDVGAVRFKKSLTTNVAQGELQHEEQTVFVVNSSNFVNFLTQFRLVNMPSFPRLSSGEYV